MNPANIAIFDLDHTLLPIDSDYEWGRFLCRIGAVDKTYFEQRNHDFFAQYQAGCLDAREYLEFALGTLAQFSQSQLTTLHQQFMTEVINPLLLPAAYELLARHKDDLIIIITATNRFVTEPIAHALGVQHLIAAQPEISTDGRLTGKLCGNPTSGEGKVEHLNAWLAQHNTTLNSFERSYFYSDSHNDLPLLKLVSHPVATNPNAQLSAHAHIHGWPILKIFND
ncbi:HAD family hydrolase [Solimicrobium silvestre]|uniref:HAD-SF-IB-hyp1: HAD hydrolase, family IB n=1 Tax=Solimicrobium silvestre TaxID=2099400 RepID=A0A2S9GTH7_9BURK|nr:HAD family hydrolase [Solimicrobium silvestre]PRC91015.1 HAD-SF-IB-hyp1: HAD hydrolase, family IB [Solimicrobium silvestre]